MIEFFTRLFKREASGTTAKERLRLVLLSDHLALAPDVVASMKADLLEVISRYVDIDPAHSDVTFEQQDRTIAMLANVPILGLKAREVPPYQNGHANGRRAPESAHGSPSPAEAASGPASGPAQPAISGSVTPPPDATEVEAPHDAEMPEFTIAAAAPRRPADATDPTDVVAAQTAEAPPAVVDAMPESPAATPMLPLEPTREDNGISPERGRTGAGPAEQTAAAAPPALDAPQATNMPNSDGEHDAPPPADDDDPEPEGDVRAPKATAPKTAGAKPRARRRRRRPAAKAPATTG